MCAEQPVEFEGDEITLDISKHGAQLAGGWTVLPYTHPSWGEFYYYLHKKLSNYELCKSSTDPQEQDQHICSWSTTALLPFACEVKQYQTELNYTVQLNGTKEPNHWIRLPIIQPPQG